MGISIRIASHAKGLGAFASRRIPAFTYLGIYGGETFTADEVRARFWGKREMDDADKEWAESRKRRGQAMTGNYLVELPDKSFIDAEDADRSSWCRFMNHIEEENYACNCKPFLKSSEGQTEDHEYPYFYSIRDIEIGEELLWDYGEHFFK